MINRIKTRFVSGGKFSRYKLRREIANFLFSLFRIMLLVSIGYIVIYPLLYMLVTAFRTPQSYSDPGIVWIVDITLENFKDAFKVMNYPTVLKNTLLLQVISAFLEIMSCSLVAYGLSRFEFKAKKYLLIVLFASIIIPTQMIIIPMMMNFSHLDFLGIFKLIGNIFNKELRLQLLNTPWTFWLPSFFGVGLKSGMIIFIYMQFFKGLPVELEEAAWIDGAGPLTAFLRIALPSSGVVILTVSIFSVIWHWNDTYLSTMLMNESEILSLVVSDIKGHLATLGIDYVVVNGRGGSVMMAGCLFTIFPPLVMYMILQRKFVKSIDRIGITG